MQSFYHLDQFKMTIYAKGISHELNWILFISQMNVIMTKHASKSGILKFGNHASGELIVSSATAGCSSILLSTHPHLSCAFHLSTLTRRQYYEAITFML